MKISDRLTKLLYIKELDALLSADIKGKIHLFDRDLNLICSSPSTHYTNMINAITYDDNYVFTKDIKGTIGKWDLLTLKPLDFHDPYSLRDNELLQSMEEEPSPSLSRGIGAYNGKVFTNNGYGQFVVLDQETFEVMNILPKFNENSFVDCVNTENEKIQAISETCGMLHLGDLERLHFDKKISIDSGNVHIIRYDKRHDRFIATQDYGLDEDRNVQNGIVTLDFDSLEKHEYPFTTDDVEFLEFNEDYSKVYTGGFDACLYVFDNTERELKLTDVIGPFNHQIVMAVYVEGNIYLLMQSGEFIKTDEKGNLITQADFQYKCVWALEHHPKNNAIVYSASGYDVDVIEYSAAAYNSIKMKKIAHHSHSFGILFRICPLNDGSYLALSRSNTVFKADPEGHIIWYRRFEDLPKNVYVNDSFDKAMVGLDNGMVYEINMDKGEVLQRLSFKSPVYITGYTKDDKKIVGTKQGDITVYDQQFNIINSFNLDGYPKRFLGINDKHYIVGSFGFVEVDLEDGKPLKTFIELLWNTKENGIVLGDNAFVISYGKQIGAYHVDSVEMVDLVEPLYDYPKGLAGKVDEEGNQLLLVGGNGGFINAYRIIDGSPIKVREFYI
ncbi:hypothetical protein [Bacillus chungangensis]|uniref:WD40 repeat domain-containing protein n=1 Tax=Bacillus chungangensis TaxID=587633 RepID=A0ABT9WW14_9BACI|nr:hypothetical protein [Bacillus chungangensis]MDQ0177488.1 hypothetical protein [Bacillus chungangensis]